SIAAANYGGISYSASATSSSNRWGDMSTAIGDLLGRVRRPLVRRRLVVGRTVRFVVLLGHGGGFFVLRLGAGLRGRRRLARLAARLVVLLLLVVPAGADAALHRRQPGLVLQQRADLAVDQVGARLPAGLAPGVPGDDELELLQVLAAGVAARLLVADLVQVGVLLGGRRVALELGAQVDDRDHLVRVLLRTRHR